MATQTFTADGTWVCPAGVESVQVECYGSGGNGAAGSNYGGGGGSGGAYAKKTITVVPGTTYNVHASNSPEFDAYWEDGSLVLAKGGNSASGQTGGAATSGSIGDVTVEGPHGGNGGDAGPGSAPPTNICYYPTYEDPPSAQGSLCWDGTTGGSGGTGGQSGGTTGHLAGNDGGLRTSPQVLYYPVEPDLGQYMGGPVCNGPSTGQHSGNPAVTFLASEATYHPGPPPYLSYTGVIFYAYNASSTLNPGEGGNGGGGFYGNPSNGGPGKIVLTWTVPTYIPSGMALLLSRSGALHKARPLTGKIVHKRAMIPLFPYGSQVNVTAGTTDNEPRLMEDATGRLYCLFVRGSGIYEAFSDDQGATWSTPVSLFTSGKHPETEMDRASGLIVRAAYVSGNIKVRKQGAGQLVPSDPVSIKNSAGTAISVIDDTFRLVPVGGGRWLLSVRISGESAPSDWMSDDGCLTWTRCVDA
jgi:hypothetical protein